MLTSRYLLAIAITVIFVLKASSTIYRVDNNPANNPDFTSLQDAHDAAAAGDTLYVSGSAANYGGITLSKTLYIFGPGYFLAENPETNAKLLPANIGQAIFNQGSEGSIIAGCRMYDVYDMVIQTSSITLKRNNILTWYSLKVNSTNNIICQNYIQGGISFSTGSNAIIRNNFITGPIGPNSSANPPLLLDITNNVLQGDIQINSAIFYNNILRTGNFDATNCEVRNNIGNSTQFGTENGNQENVDMNTVFIGAGSTDGMWQLAAGSPAIGAGVSGEDCGMYGAVDPYVLSGLPPIPAVYFFVAPPAASGLEGLPVQVKVKSHK